jgi:3-hydroxybutyryl-CoA dehydrogenase
LIAAIETIAILGAGTMGQGIAQVTSAAGKVTRLFDALPGRAEEAVAAIAVRRESHAARRTAHLSSHLSVSASPTLEAACESADLVIEAAPEDLEIKVAVLRAALQVVHSRALLASNTSSLSLTEIGARIGASERTLGLHFFNPPPVMELVEVVRGLRTSEDAVDRAVAFARSIGKRPIVVRDVPGFATSRLGVLLGAEAIRMLESGVAGVSDIDAAMELGYRHPMGPLKLTDLVGLDVRLAILENLHRELGERFQPPVLLRQMVREGRLGKKSGEGFYVWRDGAPETEGTLPAGPSDRARAREPPH